MNNIGIFFGTTSGKTASIVEEIEFSLRKAEHTVFDVKNGISEIDNFSNLILVVPTYGVGELQKDWEDHFDEFKKIDFSGKIVALVGLGDQYRFGESFIGALKTIYDVVIENGGKIIGFTDTEGYNFKECEAIVDGKFVGLALDEHHQDDLSPDRILFWVKDILSQFC